LAQIIYTSGTESRPRGRAHATTPSLPSSVSCLVTSRSRRTIACCMACRLYQLRHSTLPRPCCLLGATNIIHGQADAANLLALMGRDRSTRFRAAHGVDLLMRASRIRHRRPVVLAQGLLRASIMPWGSKEIPAALPASAFGILWRRKRSVAQW